MGRLLLLITLTATISSQAGCAYFATRDYVDAADRKFLQEDFSPRVDAILVEDRKQIAQLQQTIIAQETKLEEASRQVAELSETVAKFGADMENQAQTFATLAGELQASTSGLSEAITMLPTDTLKLLSEALQQHLADRDVADELWSAPKEEVEEEAPAATDEEVASAL